MENKKEPEFVIKPCTHTGLARAYGISRKVLYSRLRPYREKIGPRKGYKYSLLQLLVIFELIGFPAIPII
jgi:hypothetical protein